MKTIWFVYPYGNLPVENSFDMRYIRFGKRLASKYMCVWWTADFSHSEKEFRSLIHADGKNEIVIQRNLSIRLVPTTGYKKNISVRRVLFEVNYARNLRKIWAKEDAPDLIITPGTGVITAFRPVWPYIKDRKTKAIFDIMDIHPLPSYIKRHHPTLYPFVKPMIWFNGLREKKFYNNVSGVSGLARGQLEIAKSRINNKKVPSCLVYNSICVEKFRAQMTVECNISLPNKNEGWIWCIYAGSLGPSYDIPTIINCANRCKNNGKKVLFIIAGSGEYASVCKQNINDQVVFLEHLDKRDLVPVYSKCDIGLCTYADFSTVDMPDKIYDYTAAGLAIVNSLHGEIEEHVRSSRLGVQYSSGDAYDLYEKICLFEDESFLTDCKKNSWRIAGEFDFEKQLDLLEGFINRIDEQDNS